MEEKIEALRIVVGVLAISVADTDPNFRKNFTAGLTMFRDSAESHGKDAVAEAIEEFSAAFQAASAAGPPPMAN